MNTLKFPFLIFLSFNFSLVSGQTLDEPLRKFHILRMEGNLDEAFKLINEIEKKALRNKLEILPKIYLEYSKYYFSAENFTKAKEFADKAYRIGFSSEISDNKSYGLFAKAYYNYQLNLDEAATNYANQARKIVETNKSSDYKLCGDIYYLLYRINSHQDDFTLSDKYAGKAIFMAKKAEDYELLMNAFSAKSTSMGFGFAKTKNEVYSDSIKIYLDQSIELYKKHSNIISERTYAITNINLANLYFSEFSESGSPEAKNKTIFHLNTVDQLTKIADFNYELRANVLGIRSQIAIIENNLEQAEFYLRSAFNKLTQETNRPAYYVLSNISTALQELYKKTGDYKKALFFADKNADYQKKIFDESSASNIRSLEAKFENEKIGNQLKISEEKSEQRKTQNYMLSAILLLLCTTVYFILRNYRNKFNLQKKRTESFEKDKLRAIKELNLENEARKILAAEQKILKLENEKVQKEALIQSLLLEQKNQILKNIGDQIKHEPDQQDLIKVLKQNAQADSKLHQTAVEFKEINPIFFEKIEIKYGSKLTPRDVKLCAYLYLGLNNKEISIIFNVEPKTIRMSKYRIKKKLELDADLTLEQELKVLLND